MELMELMELGERSLMSEITKVFKHERLYTLPLAACVPHCRNSADHYTVHSYKKFPIINCLPKMGLPNTAPSEPR